MTLSERIAKLQQARITLWREGKLTANLKPKGTDNA